MKKIATLILTLVLGFGFVGGFSGCKQDDTSKPIKKDDTTKKDEKKEEKKEEKKD